MSFDPGLALAGFPNYQLYKADARNQPSTPSQELPKDILWTSNQDIDAQSPKEENSTASSKFVKLSPSLYQTMNMGNGDAHGFDLSYSIA
jgi:hypothetical protein